MPAAAWAGGPKYVAGATYFNAAVVGTSVHWAGGRLNYYVDQGALSATVTNAQATAMVDAAAALWSAVATAGVTLTDKGSLNENVSGSNVLVNSAGYFAQPSDLTASATNYPVAVIYDYDGSVIDAVYGADTSQPDTCQNNGVYVWLDNINPDATIAHAVMILNGRCTSTAKLLTMMNYEIERAFGRILGLDYSQVNPGALKNVVTGGTQGWPIMQPLSGVCGGSGGECIPNPTVLRYDDIAALNRIYPITVANLSSFPGKELTAENTVSIKGTVSFSTGYGMQGVNVVARPLDSSGNPLYKYTVSAVTGALFNGNHGNAVTGWYDASGALLTKWGSEDASLQGEFELSYMPLPPGTTSANYQVSFETIVSDYINAASVGPYTLAQVAPSGTLDTITVSGLAAGSSKTLTVAAAGSAAGGYGDALGSENQPRQLPYGGFWVGRLSQVGQTDWFSFSVRGNRTFTVVTVALNESGEAVDDKALPAIGVWDGFDTVGATAIGYAPGLNGYAAGESWLRVTASGDDIVRLGVTDQRGDGRPDYAYQGWVLYADRVTPAHLPASGGDITIYGTGFRIVDTVLVGGKAAVVTSITPNQITAIAPASSTTGSVDVEVDDQSSYYAAAIISGGVSYNAGSGDKLTIDTAPAGTVPIGEPLPFTVTATTSSATPASGVTVTYTVSSGSATLGCGYASCAVTATGDGIATIKVTAVNGSAATVTASLANGVSVQTQFTGGSAPAIASLTSELYLAAGASFSWTVQVLALTGGAAASGQTIVWQSPASGIALPAVATATTNSSGIATKTLAVGPLSEGQTATIEACVNGTSSCVIYTAYGAQPEYAQLRAVSGTSQSLASSATPSQIVLRLLDANGNQMAGGTVTLYQSLYAWTKPCAAHTVCAQGALLAAQSNTASSAVDGTVSFIPQRIGGVATNLQGLAVSGNTATASVTIEEYP
jgi:hypothetical protein